MSSPPLSEPKPRRRRQPTIRKQLPKQLRKEIAQQARDLSKRYDFIADRTLKQRVVRLMAAMLPPRPRRRGRPCNEEITRAILLYSRARRQHPEEKPHESWERVCVLLYPGYEALPDIARRDTCEGLRLRVKSRFRSRRGRKSR
jgi:hypothetical protein